MPEIKKLRTVVVEGVATATEVSTVGTAYTVLAGLFVYCHFNWKRLVPMLVDTASLSGAIVLIIGCATAMAWALTPAGSSKVLIELIAVVPGDKYGFMAISVIAFTVLGSVLEGIRRRCCAGHCCSGSCALSASTRCTTR